MKFFKNKKGFTLVELVVVIAILGILAGIAIPRFMDATASARGSKVVADLRTIDSAITMYYAKNGSYPDTVSAALTTNPLPDYLAQWPAPQTGSIIFPSNKKVADSTISFYKYTKPATTGPVSTVGSATGRALWDTYTAEDLSAGSSRS